jgi:hypothetical protein
LSPSTSRVVSPICCRKTTIIGNDDHQIGLNFLLFLFFVSRQRKERKVPYACKKYVCLFFAFKKKYMLDKINSLKF